MENIRTSNLMQQVITDFQNEEDFADSDDDYAE